MRTLLPDPPPAQIAEYLERRRRAGADRRDEIWKGVLHMVPAPSGWHAKLEWRLAAVLSPLAEAAGLHSEKLPFYAAHAVDEVLIDWSA